jgi:predicted lipid-binding transport protein (Tim44 family)
VFLNLGFQVSTTLILAAISFLVLYKLFKTFGCSQAVDTKQTKDINKAQSVNKSNASMNLLVSEIESIFSTVFTAFAESKHDILKRMLSQEMYESFAEQISKREKKNLRQEIDIKHIETVIENTQTLEGRVILTVLFKVSQMSATINEEGKSFDNPNKLYVDVCHRWKLERKTEDNSQWLITKTSIV